MDPRLDAEFKYCSSSELATKLFTACEVGDLPAVKKLIDYGVSLTGEGYRASHLEVATTYSRYEVVKYLVESGASSIDDAHSALVMTEGDNRYDIIKYLVGKGADITFDDNFLIRCVKVNDDDLSACFLYNLVLNEMKKYALFLLLNKSNGININIHKDLTRFAMKPKYIDHYRFYQDDYRKSY